MDLTICSRFLYMEPANFHREGGKLGELER